MKFAGVVVLYNPSNELLENIKTYLPLVDKLFVMDNSTKPIDFLEDLKSIKKIEYISMGGNKGIAKALKDGTEKAIKEGYDYLLSMDQDSKYPTSDFDIIKSYIENNDMSKVGIIAINYVGSKVQSLGDDKSYFEKTVGCITSGSILNLKSYKNILGYDEKLFIDLVDTDLCCQLIEKGFDVLFFRNIVLEHRLGEAQTSNFLIIKKKRSVHRSFRYYYMYRNFYYLKKNRSKQYQKVFKNFYSRYGFLSIIYRTLFGNPKIETFKMIRKGIKDGKQCVLGELNSDLNNKILVTGVNGQLGYDIVKELNLRGYNNVRGVDIADLDLTDEKAVKKYLKEYKPNVIMHNAAWTAVDKAEEMQEQCYNVNVLATRYLTNCAKKLNAKIVYISTDYVFDGNGDNFFEVDDKKAPLSVYGKTKLQGEEEVKKCNNHFIVRISWVFGINGKNFIKTMLNLAETKKELSVVSDQIGSPTYTKDLSKLLCDMIKTDKYGTYHATNEGICSWNEFAKKIFKLAGKDVVVNSVLTADYPAKAPRPLNSRLSKQSLDNAGFNRLPSWEDALERYLYQELKIKK